MLDRKHRGFTLIELIIAISIITIIAGIFISPFSKFRNDQLLKAGAENIASVITKARSATLASINDSSFGVHFSSDSVILFSGETYDSGNSLNEIITLNEAVTVDGINLTGGVDDVYFERLTGKASATGTISVSLTNDNTKTKTITITSLGAVKVE